MADNFDLKKFLKESKALENLNPAIKTLNENEMSMDKKMTKEAIRQQIKDMIVAELELSVDDSGKADDADANPDLNDFLAEDELEEAKKKDKEEEVDVEDVEVTGEEDVPAADAEVTGAEDVPAADGGGLEDLAADMKGT
jgi:hypothetical protein